MILSSCSKKNEEVADKKEKIDVTMFEENDKKRSKYKGYTVEEVYLDGKKVKIDVQSHGDHYHIIYEGKKYSLSKEKYNELFNKDNKIVLGKENIEKSLAEINADEIISYYRHGDHWHVKTRSGEFITYEDPSKIKDINVLRANSISILDTTKLNNVYIVSYYKHGNHWHVRTSDGKEYVTHTDPSGNNGIDSIGDREELKPELPNKVFDRVLKHDDHVHVWINGKEHIISLEEYERAIRENRFEPKKEENNGNTLTDNELREKAEVMVQEIMKKYNLNRNQIKIDLENNVIVYPHGSHYHYDKIDPSKPGGHGHGHDHHHHNIEQPKRNPEIENLKVVGPFHVENSKWIDNKREFMEKYKVEGIKNIENYNFLTFITDNNELKENLEVNGKKSKVIIYLVLYGVDKSELSKIKTPNVILKDGQALKGWTGGAFDEVVRRDISRIAQIRKSDYKNSPKVLGPFTPEDDVSNLNIDKRDYYQPKFFAQGDFSGKAQVGQFELNGKKSRYFYYFVRDDISLEEAKNCGYKVPVPVGNEGYEFIGWNNDPNNKKFNGADYFLGLFGTNKTLIGSYIPSNPNNPYDLEDRNRPHPRGAVFYNPENYTTLVIKAGENGMLDGLDFGVDKVKIVCLVIRKGTTWKDLSAYYPIASPNSGYGVALDYYGLLTKSETIGENKEYIVNFVKNESNNLYGSDDLYGSGNLYGNESLYGVPSRDEDLLGINSKNTDENKKTENPKEKGDSEKFLGEPLKNNTEISKEVEKPKINDNVENEKNKNNINSEKQTVDKKSKKSEKIEKENSKELQPVEKDKNL